MSWQKCARCGGAFQAHFSLAASATARWRGPSFEAAQAAADVGLAVMEAMGLSVRAPGAAEKFQREVMVKPHRLSETPFNPREKFDPVATPEPWEFHVGWLATPPAVDVLDRARMRALAALSRAKGFRDARPLP